MDFGKLFLLIGVAFIILGLVLTLGLKIPFLGKLPGDIFIQRDNVRFYFPLASSIIISLILTLLLNIFLRK